ncbi:MULTISPECIES: acetyl-CoA carboxylase biotin carboxyl carrier protein [Croceibacter]|uniref:acetyl-CoA carboxylase biotin carboxyl carrier protein n=2 Tax=Flavobacteriaceae TaxID=49546 RepID=UPI000C450BB7|nr:MULTISPECIES: acetyl-CoA carboxylase biotin carboxyl carrier protein [Croceibacter]MBG26022.1 acetyl-CoA carboxylase, biotin carboxyl carrier protein [Croceibacter sp.]|tara:strand:+ start:5203 stop:5700 length:498 start_codon:yes stop_codon:yes gene_type:complete
MELKDIQNLIKFVAKSGASEVKLEMEDVKITIKTGSDEKETIVQHMQMPAQMPQQMAAASAPAPAQPVAQAAAAAPADSNNGDDSKYITVKSPIIGTFYRKPSPDKDLFCEVGDSIKEGDVLCIIEAMKLFNEIESEVSGKIVKVLVDDSSPVEFDQPLFLVDPS